MTAPGIMIAIMFCVMGVIVIATSFITLILCVICDCICWPCFERRERDIELGIISIRARIIAYREVLNAGHDHHEHEHDDDDENNNNESLVIHGLPSSTEERKILRQQALEKLLPSIVFGSKESSRKLLLSGGGGECSICLDDYKNGELCRVFPSCNHMFHLKCIDHWLNNHLTCPVCRKCLL